MKAKRLKAVLCQFCEQISLNNLRNDYRDDTHFQKVKCFAQKVPKVVNILNYKSNLGTILDNKIKK